MPEGKTERAKRHPSLQANVHSMGKLGEPEAGAEARGGGGLCTTSYRSPRLPEGILTLHESSVKSHGRIAGRGLMLCFQVSVTLAAG